MWAYQIEALWFDSMRNDQNFEQHWRSDFRMSQDTFRDIVRVVQPALEKRDTQFRRAIPIEKQLHYGDFRQATLFVLLQKHLQSANQRLFKLLESFVQKCCVQVPQVLGALDGTNIPIVAPNVDGKADYFSRKQRYTISTQGLVGANLVFLDVATGFPGSCHDARNFRNTSLYTQAENGEILTKPEDVIENSRFRPLLVGDGAYPLLPWLIKSDNFGPALTCSQKLFNKKICSARVTVERAFDILKARWRCLLKRLDNHIENNSAVIIACCVLHNVCQNE